MGDTGSEPLHPGAALTASGSQTAFSHYVLHMETPKALLSSLPMLATVLLPTGRWIMSLPTSAVVVLPEYAQKSACVLSDSEH